MGGGGVRWVDGWGGGFAGGSWNVGGVGLALMSWRFAFSQSSLGLTLAEMQMLSGV